MITTYQFLVASPVDGESYPIYTRTVDITPADALWDFCGLHSSIEDALWPEFYFSFDLELVAVEGADITIEIVKYRQGESMVFFTSKQVDLIVKGLKKRYGEVSEE